MPGRGTSEVREVSGRARAQKRVSLNSRVDIPLSLRSSRPSLQPSFVPFLTSFLNVNGSSPVAKNIFLGAAPPNNCHPSPFFVAVLTEEILAKPDDGPSHRRFLQFGGLAISSPALKCLTVFVVN